MQFPPCGTHRPGADSIFSVHNALADLDRIAAAPHSIGTPEHDKVMRYIISGCLDAGLSAEIQTATAVRASGRGLVAAEVHNIIAVKKGVRNSRSILVIAHYDSQPNTFGASDDGVGVAAMLETARALRNSGSLRNDIIFLFTDAEECGLLGAKAFIDGSPLMRDIGIVLNFDARGSSGVTTMFEVNPENGWIVSEYIDGAVFPHANSLSFEIYKSLPNDTDYSLFKMAGVAGLNNAFIEGFVNYHSMTDNRERLDSNTVRNEGENMLSLVKHFGRTNITRTKAKDISYFNLFGGLIVHYPNSLNVVLVILVFALLIFRFTSGIRKGTLSIRAAAAGAITFILTLTAIYFLTGLLVKGIRFLSPFSDRFDSMYNSSYYLFAIASFGMTLFGLIYGLVIKILDARSVIAGCLIVQALVLPAILFVAPGATWFLLFPLLGVLAGDLVADFAVSRRKTPEWSKQAWRALFSLPALLIMSPVIYLTFIAFDLGPQLPAAVLLFCLLLGSLLPMLLPVLKMHRHLLPAASAVCFLLSISIGVYHAGFTEKQPLRTDLQYVRNADSGKAVWVSDYSRSDSWSRQFFLYPKRQTMPGRNNGKLVSEAPVVDLPVTRISIQRDTIENGRRLLTLGIKTPDSTACLRILISRDNPADKIILNGKTVAGTAGNLQRLDYYNPGGEVKLVQFVVNPSVKFKIRVIDRNIGMPLIAGYKPLPDNMIFGPSGNFTEAQKDYAL